jgi:hypothetical protein
VTEVDGLAPEFKEAARRHLGEERANAFFEQNNKPGVRMARIAVRPTLVTNYRQEPPGRTFSYSSFAYSALASFRMGISGSASFHKAKKS